MILRHAFSPITARAANEIRLDGIHSPWENTDAVVGMGNSIQSPRVSEAGAVFLPKRHQMKAFNDYQFGNNPGFCRNNKNHKMTKQP